MGYTTGKKGIELIKSFEGCKLTAYKCPAGVWTIGYGHTLGVTSGQSITQAQAETFLKVDLASFEKSINSYVKVSIHQNQFDALVSFSYNCGSTALKNSTLLKKLNAGDYSGATAEFAKWNKAGGKELAGLTRRRAAETALFNDYSCNTESNETKASGATSSGTTASSGTGSTVKVDSAEKKDASLAGTYKVTASSLKLRAGAGTNKTIIAEMPCGAKVQCYGYYTTVSGVKWLYVVYNGKTGFASSQYLKE